MYFMEYTYFKCFLCDFSHRIGSDVQLLQMQPIDAELITLHEVIFHCISLTIHHNENIPDKSCRS